MKKYDRRAGEMAQLLEALDVLLEDPGSIPTTHTQLTIVTPVPGDPWHQGCM